MHAPPPDLIFVYGTLRRAAGHPAHRLVVEHGEFVGNGFVRGCLYDAGEYPGLALEAAAGTVAGEVYRLFAPAAALARLDAYEGGDATASTAAEFRREPADVALNDGCTVRAWLYVYQRPVAPLTLIPSGDYVQFLREKS